MLTILGSLAEFERELIRARTGEGRKRAQAREAKFGQPPKLNASHKSPFRLQVPSQPSGPGLLKGVVLILVTRFSTELPAMVVCRHRVGKCQSQHRGLFCRIVRTP